MLQPVWHTVILMEINVNCCYMLLFGLWKIGNWKCAAQRQHDTATYDVQCETFSNQKCFVGRHSTHTWSTTYVSGLLWITTNVDKRQMWALLMYERKHPLDVCKRNLMYQMHSFLMANWRDFEKLMRFSMSETRLLDLKENERMCSRIWLTFHWWNATKIPFYFFLESTELHLRPNSKNDSTLEIIKWKSIKHFVIGVWNYLMLSVSRIYMVSFRRKELLNSKFCTKSWKAESGGFNLCKNGFPPQANTFVSSAINFIYGYCSSTNLPTCTCIGTKRGYYVCVSIFSASPFRSDASCSKPIGPCVIVHASHSYPWLATKCLETHRSHENRLTQLPSEWITNHLKCIVRAPGCRIEYYTVKYLPITAHRTRMQQPLTLCIRTECSMEHCTTCTTASMIVFLFSQHTSRWTFTCYRPSSVANWKVNQM